MSAVIRLMAQEVLSPAKLGLSAVVLSAEKTSNSFSLWGYPNLAVFVVTTWHAATRIDVNLDVTPDGWDMGAISNWMKSQSATIASGAATMDELDIQKATSNAVVLFEVRFTELNAVHGRLRISSTAGDTDTATVTGILAGPM